MGKNNWEGDKTGATATGFQGSGKSYGCGNVKTMIADKIQQAAEALGEKAAEQDAGSGVAQYEKRASEWLEQSAEFVRQFDYEQTDARVREFVRKNPGRSLLIAGGVGLIIGTILRRR